MGERDYKKKCVRFGRSVLWDHSFSTYVKFSEKLAFLYTYVLVSGNKK